MRTNWRWRAVALVAVGIALGMGITAAPVTAHVTGSVAHLIKHLKKSFYTKKAANKRFYTKKQVNGKLGGYYTKGEVDTKLGDYYTKGEVDTKLGGYYTKAEVDTKFAADLTIGISNGVGNELGCASGTLAVGITNGNSAPVDHRFTFQVPGAPEAFGQIRSDGSIRNSSANVASVTHAAGSGVYCIVFTAAPGQNQLESSVVSLHYYG